MTREHPMRDAGLAVALLTIVPVRTRWPDGGVTQAAGWFPVVGGLVGCAAYGVVKLAETTTVLARAPWVVATIAVGMLALVTRFLHWDGLADVADGYWGSHEPARRLEIMSDSHTGAFGATAIALVVALEVLGLGSFVVAHQSPVLVIPLIARLAATAAAWLGKPAKPGGLGRSVMGPPSFAGLVPCLLALAAAFGALWLGFGSTGIALGAFGVVVALGVPHVLALRFGGVTGDVMGASVLLTEALLLAAFALVV